MNHGFFQYEPESKSQFMHWKSPRANPNLKQKWTFFPTSEGLFTWIGYLKARPLTSSTTRRFWQNFVNGWEEGDLKCGRTSHGFLTKTTSRHKTPCLSRRFWRSTRSSCWNIHRTHLTCPHVTFFISKDQVRAKRNQVRVRRYSEGKNDGAHE